METHKRATGDQLVPHDVVAKKLRVPARLFIEGIRKGLIPFQQYSVDPVTKWETWLLGAEDIEQAGIRLAAQVDASQRLYNWFLQAARDKAGLTTRQLGDRAGVAVNTMRAYEALRRFPSPARAELIAQVLGVPAEVLFPEKLKEFRFEQARSVIEEAHFSLEGSLRAGTISFPTLPDPAEEMEAWEFMPQPKETVSAALSILTHTERAVVELRLGLRGAKSQTLQEVAKAFRVTRERIRQIEAKALMKLRYRTRR